MIRFILAVVSRHTMACLLLFICVEKRKKYIAYGSNLNLEQMAFRCPTAKVVGKSELKDYELLFRGGRRGAVATVEPKAGSTVPILVWEIQKKDEASLDLYEGYPNFYDKQMLEIELDEGICSILDYFEIFLQRMLMCKRAAEMLGMKFKMKANGNKIC